jgi:hypothetical protein
VAISLTEKLEIYRRALARYEAAGDLERADIQRRMIAWMRGRIDAATVRK